MATASYVIERDLDRCGGSGVIVLELRNATLHILVLEKDPSSAEWTGAFGEMLANTCRQLAEDMRFWVRTFSHPYNPRKPFHAEIPVEFRWDAWRPNALSPAQMSRESNKLTIPLRIETDRNALGLADLFQEMRARMEGELYAR